MTIDDANITGSDLYKTGLLLVWRRWRIELEPSGLRCGPARKLRIIGGRVGGWGVEGRVRVGKWSNEVTVVPLDLGWCCAKNAKATALKGRHDRLNLID